MTDTNDDAYDSLGSSFVSSFSLPPPSPREHKPSETSKTDSTDVPQLIIPAAENKNEDAPDPIVNSQPEQAENTTSDDPSAVRNVVPAAQEQAKVAPVQEDWKELLDKNLESWQAESAEARAKSESTRLRIEEERVKEAKRIADEEKALAARLRQEKEDAEVEKKVQALLAAPVKGKKPAHHHHHEGEMDPKRWTDVRNAWEGIRDGATAVHRATKRSEFEEEDPVEVDGRDMTAGDHGGRDGNKAAEVLQKLSAATQAVTQGDGNLNPTPASATRRADLLSASHHKADAVPNQREAVADAWRSNAQKSSEEKGAGNAAAQKHPRAAAGEKETRQPAKSSSSPAAPVESSAESAKEDQPAAAAAAARASSSSASGHPQQPPSLTLSLFSGSGHRSLSRIAAVVGINIVLPFINGVMLGFGEIFAREVIAWTRGWWRGERALRIGGGRWSAGSGAAAVAGRGLMEGARSMDSISGSGSFP